MKVFLFGRKGERMIKKIGWLMNIREFMYRDKELLWAWIWHDTIDGAEWFKNLGVSPGRWAVGYNYLYVMTRILEDIEPQMVLDIGLGVSTKLISQYFVFKCNKDAKHIIIEHDEAWIEFYMKKNILSPYSTICLQSLIYKNMGKEKYPAYEDIGKDIENKKFNVISIDAPYGGDNYSRRDILDFLPEVLADSFVIVIDDAQRKGEKRTISDIKEILEKYKIQYVCKNYRGLDDCYVITSIDNKFLCTL